MKIDISKIDQERFHVNHRTIPHLGDFVLIVPHKAMWDWNADELHLRSLLCRKDGEVVSAGFPKFFNFGENPDHDKRVVDGLAMGLTRFTEKVDGSLIIATHITGELGSRVHFRTRGCENIAEDMRGDVEELIRRRYPALLEPANYPKEHSMLLEYISPKNQIVVKYDEPRLVLLGWTYFGGQSLVVAPPETFPPKHLVSTFPETVRTFKAEFDAEGLRENVKGYEDQEGVVTWTLAPHPDRCRASTMHLCKFKSAWYLRLHALRSQATPRYLKEFCYVNSIRTIEQLRDAFYKEGFDWEIVSYVEPMFDEIKTFADGMGWMLDLIDQKINEQGIKSLPSRKDIALATKELTSEVPRFFGYAMARATGDDALASELADGLKLDMSVQQLRQLKKQGLEKLGAGKVYDDG